MSFTLIVSHSHTDSSSTKTIDGETDIMGEIMDLLIKEYFLVWSLIDNILFLRYYFIEPYLSRGCKHSIS